MVEGRPHHSGRSRSKSTDCPSVSSRDDTGTGHVPAAPRARADRGPSTPGPPYLGSECETRRDPLGTRTSVPGNQDRQAGLVRQSVVRTFTDGVKRQRPTDDLHAGHPPSRTVSPGQRRRPIRSASTRRTSGSSALRPPRGARPPARAHHRRRKCDKPDLGSPTGNLRSRIGRGA